MKVETTSIRIAKADLAEGFASAMVKDMGLKPNDIICIEITKVKGSPTQFLKDKYLNGGLSDDVIAKLEGKQ